MKLFQLLMEAAGSDGAPSGGGQTPTQETTPKAPAKEEPKAEVPKVVPAKEEPKKVETPQVTYTDPVAKQVSDMLTSAGLDSAKSRDAITANGGKCTPEIFAALVEKHGEGMATLLSNQMTQIHTEGVTKASEQDQAIFSQVADAFKGVTEQTGEQTWGELSGWAKENVSNDDRKELNAVIAQGGMGAKLAVQELVSLFQQSGSYSQEMVGLEGDNKPNAPKGGDLSRNEYNTQLDALLAKGHDYNTSQEVAALQARRQRSATRSL